MKFLTTCLAVCMLTACTGMSALPSGVPTSPSAAADKTVVDEQTALAVELAYQGAAQAVLLANRAGLVPASARPCVRKLDNEAYAAVLGVRSAYNAGNATSYTGAAIAARGAVSSFLQRKGC